MWTPRAGRKPIVATQSLPGPIPRRVLGTKAWDVRCDLRLATAALHASLHGHPAFAALIAGEATIDLYRCLLARLYGIYQPLEAVLARADHHLPPDLRQRRRSRVALMAQDLMALGLDPCDLERLPRKDDIQPLTSRGEALGALYVVQGSALGGKVITQSLQDCVVARPCRRYFAGFADDRETWARCCAALEKCTDVARLNATAVTTFRHIADWMTGWRSEQPADG